MRLLLWPVYILWVGGVSSQTTATSPSASPGGLAVLAQTTELQIEQLIIDYLYEYPVQSESSLSPARSSELISAYAAQNSYFDAKYSSELAPGLPASIWSIIEENGDQSAADVYGPSFTVQSWYSALLDLQIEGKKDLITFLEDFLSQTLTAEFITTTKVEEHLSGTFNVTDNFTVTFLSIVHVNPTSVALTGPPPIQNISSSTKSSRPSDTVSHAFPTSTSEPSSSMVSPTSPISTSMQSHDRAKRLGIGIGLGLGLPLLLIIGVTAFILRRRRHRKKENIHNNLESSGIAGDMTEKPELDASNTRYELGGRSQMPEADGTNRHELTGNIQPQAADSTETHELDATNQHHKADEGYGSQSEEGDISALSGSRSEEGDISALS